MQPSDVGSPAGSFAKGGGNRRGFVELDEGVVAGSPLGNPPYLDLLGRNSAPSSATRSQPPPSQSAHSLYGSKRDLWEKIPPETESSRRKNSIFASEYAKMEKPSRNQALFHSPLSTPTVPMPSDPVGTPEAPKKSRNSIFDTPQIVAKPAIKMTDEELAELRLGGSGEPGSATVSQMDTSYKPLPPPVIIENHHEKLTPIIRVRPPAIQTVSPSSISAAPLPSSLAVAAPPISRQRSTPAFSSRDGLDKSNVGTTHKLSLVTNPGVFDNINLSFLPLRKNFLGEGRYARVYLGQYTITTTAQASSQPKSNITPETVSSDETMTDATPTADALAASSSALTPSSNLSASNSSTPTGANKTTTALITCAVKRMHNNPESQAVGLAELFILRRIGYHPNIVRLIGAKDETDVDSYTVKNRLRSASLSTNGQPLPTPKNETPGSTLPSVKAPSPTSPTPQMISSLYGLDSSPRLLLLLGYEPGGTMWDYIEERKDVGIGHEMWARWAGQLAGAVEYIHSFGIIHHDIKPHNCLLTEHTDVRLADFGNASFVPACASPTMMHDPDLGFAPATVTTPSFPPSTTSLALPSPGDGPPPSPTYSAGSAYSSSMSSLRDGLGRGTQAYSAPELFETTGPDPGVYSFPIDIYSVGVTLYVMVTALEPFATARSSVHMMMAIKKGFWGSGMQPGISTFGPVLASELPQNKSRTSTPTTTDVTPAGSAVRTPSHFLSTPPERGGHGFLKFGNGDRLHETAVRMICACVEKEPTKRPTASELVGRIKDWVLGII
ncbi:hypothetical protein HDU97_006132 [Phlyctochytrium planicorne]|nr:hypothetical protein HDU97_006132 [Phlyctochytrium planicorne]